MAISEHDLIDTTAETKGAVNEIAVTNLVLAPEQVFNAARKDLSTKLNRNWVEILELRIKSGVYCTCSKMIGKDCCHAIENTSAEKMKDTDRFYLQFNAMLLDPVTRKLHRIAGFDNSKLIQTLKGEMRLHLNYTFIILLCLSKQYLVTIAYDD